MITMAMRIVFQVPIFASVHTKRPGKAGSSRQKTHSRQFHCCFSSGGEKKRFGDFYENQIEISKFAMERKLFNKSDICRNKI